MITAIVAGVGLLMAVSQSNSQQQTVNDQMAANTAAANDAALFQMATGGGNRPSQPNQVDQARMS